MKDPFFSVIIPVHQGEEFMRKGLDSIKEQSFTDYELLIVCDNCTDRSAEIAREYTDNVQEVNFGRAGLARNAALDIAKGKWIIFMDDDDWFLHEFAFEMLAKLIEGVENSTIDVIAFSFIWRGNGYARNTPQHLWPAIWNKCWRREFIGEDRFPDWVHSDDLGFSLKMHPKARTVFWDMPLYYYNFMRPGCVSERIEKGEYDDNDLPDKIADAAVVYKEMLTNGEIRLE